MNRLTMLLGSLIEELSGQLSLCAERDIAYAMKRFEHEGLSFFTITLPEFDTGFLTCIEQGFARGNEFPSFGRLNSRRLPKFLSGFSSKVFDKKGVLLQFADPDAIYAIRQICRIFKKVEIPCSDARNKSAIKNYLKNEEVLYHARIENATRDDPYLDQTARLLVSSLFSDIDTEHLNCGHGPGVTADKRSQNKRLRIEQWPERSEESFPVEIHAVPNFGFYRDIDRIRFLGVKDEPPVKVVFVPKTLKTPRVIAVEPAHMQYMQQGLMKWAVRKMESHPLTRNSIRFMDQFPNYEAARLASVNRRHSTLDLKDASDMVSLALVQRIFANSEILSYLEDSRSLHAILPDGTSVLLQKFASMGSAMCFPIEAFVFYCLIQAAVHEHLGLTPLHDTIERFSRDIKVYGDDIIVPVPWHNCIVRKLEAYCLQVNQRKSFSESHFRESCGGDFYKGVAVKPLYLTKVIPDAHDRWTPEQVLAASALSDQFYCQGLWSVASLIRGWVEQGLRRKVPLSTYKTDGLTFYSCLADTYDGWDRLLERPVRRVVNYLPRKRPDDICEDEVAATFKCLGNIGNDRSVDLEASVSPHSLRKVMGWAR